MHNPDQINDADNNTENNAENKTEPNVVAEQELIELAQKEGLADGLNTDQELSAEDGDDHSDENLSEAQSDEIKASMEAILFMSDKPVSLPRLRSTINSDLKLNTYRTLMNELRAEFNKNFRGVEIAELSLGFQLRTKPLMANVLRKMVKTQPLKLTNATMEVLAIIAYKQPITKDELDQIRGVDSGYILRSLMEKHLVKISGRSDLPGKPILYSVTHEFLELFGLKDVQGLPPLHEIEQMVAQNEVGFEEKAQAVMQEFSKVLDQSTKVLFDDSQLDEELESIRSEIAAIRTSTDFIEEQKAQEKHAARLQELAEQGLTLDANGQVVPIGSIDLANATLPEQPSPELLAQAEEAQWQRHTQMIQEAVLGAPSPAAALENASLETKSEVEPPSAVSDREPDINP